ncbi:S8 family serine peptidase, partial [Jatrophihabitans sp. YIM 134969]
AALGGARTAARTAQADLLGAARARGITLSDPTSAVDLLDAVFAEVAPADLAALAALPGVARVSRDVTLQASAAPLPAGTPTGPVTAAAPTSPSDGRGTVIAVVDTGVDSTLADLGAGFGPGHKVLGGHDFVNDDDDPMDDNAHGTHVAGIAAGTGANRITGVAPAARLTAWKVLDADGAGTTADVVRGIEAAVDPTGDHPADVVNLSLGGPGDGSDPVSRAAAAASADGVVVVAAAGNAGPGEMTIGVPAASPSVLAVGASTTGLRLATARVVGTSRDLPTWRVPWSANAPATTLQARVVDVGDGTPADYDAAGDVTGAIVSYRGYAPRSTADYPGDSYAQAALAQQRGAVAAIARQPSDLPLPGGGGIGFAAPEPGVVAAAADGAAGVGGDYRFKRLVLLGMYDADRALLFGDDAKAPVTVRLDPVVVNGQIASFSSRGPTSTGALKPDLVAPGVDILSTVPHEFGIPGDVYRLSGTSMASPAVAGAAAVLRGREPGLTEAQVRARLTGSAARLPGAAAGVPALVQGAGSLDLPAALAAHVTASPSTLSFGLAPGTGGTPNRRTVHVTNAGTTAVKASLTVALGTGSDGTATVAPSSVKLTAGGSADVVVTATSPARAGDSDLTGTVVAVMSDGSTLRVPFAQSTRSLIVRGNPQDTTGSTQVMVWSPMTLDKAPTVALRNDDSGAELSVAVHADGTAAGWYRGLVTLPTVGSYRATATGKRGPAVLTGSSSLSRIRPQASGTWQRLGRAGSAGELSVSTAAPGTAVQALPASGRPFVTTDHGTTWTQVASLPVGDGAGTPVTDPSNGKAFWYALDGAPGQPPVDPTYQGRVLRTTDLGRTWTVLPFPDVHFRAFVGDGTVLAAVVDNGVQVSRDGGKHWNLVPFVWPQTPTKATLVEGGLLVTGFSKVWRIAGIATAAPEAPRAVVTGASGFMSIGAAGRTAAAAALDGTIRISTDAGLTWSTSTVPDGDFATGARVLGTEVFVGSNDGFWRSTDAGRTWHSTPYPVFGPVGIDVERWPDKPRSLLMPLENAGLWASTDDGRTSRRIGVSGTTIEAVTTVPVAGGGSRVVVADEQGVGSLVMPAAGPVDETAWGPTGGEGRIGVAALDVAVDPSKPRSWTRIRNDASGNGGVERSTDAGATWTPVGPHTFGVSLHGLALDLRRSGHAVVAYTTLSESGVVVTDDNWATWRVQPHAGVVGRRVVVDPVTPNRLWIAADSGLYRSDDDGRTVRRVLTGTVATVFVDPARPRRVVAGGDVISVSDDGGATFRRATGPGHDVSIGSFAAVTATPPGATASVRVLFAGSDTLRPLGWPVPGRGVFRSTDGGLTWTSVAAGLQSRSVTSMAVTPDGTWLVVGTRTGGVHRAAVADLLR